MTAEYKSLHVTVTVTCDGEESHRSWDVGSYYAEPDTVSLLSEIDRLIETFKPLFEEKRL
jgi:hypothetical protein